MINMFFKMKNESQQLAFCTRRWSCHLWTKIRWKLANWYPKI